MKALSIAASGMVAQQHRTDVVANNLANMNTTGYQRSRTEFNNLIVSYMNRDPNDSSRAGESVPGGIHLGLGVNVGSVYRVHEQGALKQTGNNFDLAIQGDGYFQVQLPNGDLAYTRDGTFQLNEAGTLVTHNGFPVQPGVAVPGNVVDITINNSGEVIVTQEGGATSTVGALLLTVFPNRGGLQAVGDNLFMATEASGEAAVVSPSTNGAGSVLQGFVESSNVNAIEEVSALIRANRAYEMNSKVMKAADEMLATRR
ncbi:MAG: flagellar basal-body rod protein FlgG [Rhodospirillaceae bacterium TMED8]|nr:flagellar basal-body rod protein FlgG [Magnetovibrio sp.]OUT48120.1 MAG: flagellar basal-body rod protein FlgG [Rhodospirillaceae bacterium TMED8]